MSTTSFITNHDVYLITEIERKVRIERERDVQLMKEDTVVLRESEGFLKEERSRTLSELSLLRERIREMDYDRQRVLQLNKFVNKHTNQHHYATSSSSSSSSSPPIYSDVVGINGRAINSNSISNTNYTNPSSSSSSSSNSNSNSMSSSSRGLRTTSNFHSSGMTNTAATNASVDHVRTTPVAHSNKHNLVNNVNSTSAMGMDVGMKAVSSLSSIDPYRAHIAAVLSGNRRGAVTTAPPPPSSSSRSLSPSSTSRSLSPSSSGLVRSTNIRSSVVTGDNHQRNSSINHTRHVHFDNNVVDDTCADNFIMMNTSGINGGVKAFISHDKRKDGHHGTSAAVAGDYSHITGVNHTSSNNATVGIAGLSNAHYFRREEQDGINPSLEVSLTAMHEAIFASTPTLLPLFRKLSDDIHNERAVSLKKKSDLLSLIYPKQYEKRSDINKQKTYSNLMRSNTK
jgi:hypothetical protein